MMPSEDKMANPTQLPTAAEVQEWHSQVDPATAAARNIYARYCNGIMRRPFLRGDSDHAPIFKGVRDLTQACYEVLEELAESSNEYPAALRLLDLLQDHRCR